MEAEATATNGQAPRRTTDVERRLRTVVATHLAVDTGRLLPGARLVEDLCVDSLDAVELTMVLEDEFDIALPDELVADMCTYGDVIDVVTRQVGARAAQL
jgi:acyl carrier protein